MTALLAQQGQRGASPGFSERLRDTSGRRRANAITTAKAQQEIIRPSKDTRATRRRGEESGRSDEEIAFYDAQAEIQSAMQMMGDDKLKLIAQELPMGLRENRSVDQAHRDCSRTVADAGEANLRKRGTPPDLQETVVQRRRNRRRRYRRGGRRHIAEQPDQHPQESSVH